MHGRKLRARSVTSVDEYLELLNDPRAARLREVVRGRYPRLREDVKRRVPVCSLGTTRSWASRVFEGADLGDRHGILQGKGVRYARFHSAEDVEEDKTRLLIDEALGRRMATR